MASAEKQNIGGMYWKSPKFFNDCRPVHMWLSRDIGDCDVVGDNHSHTLWHTSHNLIHIPITKTRSADVSAILNKKEELEVIIGQCKPDIIMISETWLSDIVPDEAVASQISIKRWFQEVVRCKYM